MQESGITEPVNMGPPPQPSAQSSESSPAPSSQAPSQEGREAEALDPTPLTGSGSDDPVVTDDPGTRIRKKRRKKGKGRRSTRRRDPRRAAIRLWGTVSLVAILIFGGGAYLYLYVKEAGEKRDRAVKEMAGYVKKIEQLETAAQNAQMANGRIIDLHPESTRGSQLLPPEIGRAGSVLLLRLHTPINAPGGWELTLRDEMRNVVTKAAVPSPENGILLITATGLREGIYEISGKTKSRPELTKYLFALK
jgi:hypothetical protein